MDRPLISIIVPIYNMEECVERCIKSLISQTYSNLEIILVNDGSTDSSIKICEKYKKIDSRIVLIDVSNGGVSRARNIGYLKSKGEYIGFVDSDDWIDSKMYEMLYNNMIDSNVDISACNVYYEFIDKVVLNKTSIQDNITLTKNLLFEAVLDSEYFSGYVCNKLFKRCILDSIVKNHKIFDEKIQQCEDLLFVSKYITKCDKGVYTPIPLYHYYQSEIDDQNYRKINNRNYSLLKAYEKMFEIYSLYYPRKLNKLKYNYIKINLNFKYRVLTSTKDSSQLDILNLNINKYIKDVYKSKDINLNQKLNIMISNKFPILIGNIKVVAKKTMKYKLQGR